MNSQKTSPIKGMEPWLKKNFRWLLLVEAAVILTAGWFVLLSGAVESLQQNGLQGYQRTEQQRAERKAYLDDIRKMEQAYGNLNTERLQQIEAVIPVGLEPTQLIARMNTFAKSAHLTILSIDVVGTNQQAQADPATDATGATGASPLPNGIATAAITLNVESEDQTYDGLKRFLDELESFTPLLDLSTISYSPETTSFALQLVTYYFIEESGS